MKMWIHLDVLVRMSFIILGGRRKSSKFVQVKMAANLSLLLKVVAGQHTGSKNLTSLSGML